ncbi:Essential recombination function protein [Acinetobacter sp. ANC 5054]|uniref:ERF family protein n=1 Tax=Acinetobacter sp. ANC 5054 TaxID=1977877 RepID=UPI000A33D19C|nr:ERF family protein [Acinetobacter sp. ANC 5054]OTG83284.1 Essential recombination function protein [Acinetobacter sp. ANC 5054]
MNALQQIQLELKAPKSKYNNFGKFHYRSCEDILEAVKPLLQATNSTLIITDEVQQVGPVVVVTAKVVFTDAEGKETVVTAHAGVEIEKKGMDVAQTFGTSSSYARKYALNGMFLIDDTKDYDTDEYHNQVNQQSNRGQSNQGQQRQSAPVNTAQQKPLDQRYQDALVSIRNAKKPETLDKAINTFGNTKFNNQIRQACRARADQMDWSEAPPQQNNHQQQSNVRH